MSWSVAVRVTRNIINADIRRSMGNQYDFAVLFMVNSAGNHCYLVFASFVRRSRDGRVRRAKDTWLPILQHCIAGQGSGTGTGFDGNVDVGVEGCDNLKDGFGIVCNSLIGENLALLVQDADWEDVLVVVNTDINW